MRNGISQFRPPILGFLFGLVAVVLLSGAAFALGVVGNDDEGRPDVLTATPKPPPPAQPPVKSVPEGLVSRVGLFRESSPGNIESSDNGEKELGLNYELARSGRTPDGTALVLVPGQKLTCLEAGANQSCVSTGEVLAGALFHLQVCSPDLAAGYSRIFGLLPDGAESVSLTTYDSGPIRLPVEDNLYDGDIKGMPNLLSWTDADGVVHELPIAGGPGELSKCANAQSGADAG